MTLGIRRYKWWIKMLQISKEAGLALIIDTMIKSRISIGKSCRFES